jgi:hypothetical protein
MATRRKYKQPKGYRDGGAVVPADVVPLPPEIIAPAEPIAPAPVFDEDPVQAAIRATIRAEELQRQGMGGRTQVDVRPAEQPADGLSEHKRRFLEQHPEMFEPFRLRAMRFYYGQALNDGVADDSEAMDRYILDGVERELAMQRDQAKDNASAWARANTDHLQTTPAARAPMPSTAAPSPAPPARRSIPMAAPPSREAPTTSGVRANAPSQITLSAEERDIARKSRPDLPAHQAEKLYAENRERLNRLRAAGLYPQRETN